MKKNDLNDTTVPEVIVYISADSIYKHSIVEITFKASVPFSIASSGKVLTINCGNKTENGMIEAIQKDEIYLIEFEALDWFQERNTNNLRTVGPHNSYGMRFYPFVSSFLKGSIVLEKGSITSFILDLPDDFRLIWNYAQVTAPNGENGKLDHAYGPERSKYLFTWGNNRKSRGEYSIQIPVRLSGTKLFSLTHFPLYYWVVSLFGVGAAALHDKTSILFAAIVAVWVFMLRRWGLSNTPQRNTLLTRGYIIAGTIILIWGINWELFLTWGKSISIYFRSIWLITFPAIVSAILIIVFRSLLRFNLEGRLPTLIENYWSREIEKAHFRQPRN